MAALVRGLAAVLIVLLALAAVQLGRAPLWLLVVYLALGVVSIGIYWADKAAAEAGRWRIPELRLLSIDLVGGIAGGLVAQALLRHKTRKASFAGTTWIIVLIHVFALATLVIGFWDFPGYR